MYWLPQVEERRVDPIIPSLRDGAPFGTAPGNKLPGYHHSVPSGQQPPLPVHIFESKSLRSPGFEDEDSLSDVAFCARWLAVLSASEVGRTKFPLSIDLWPEVPRKQKVHRLGRRQFFVEDRIHRVNNRGFDFCSAG